jgi:predicted transcriptional regulator YdeE
MEKIDVVTRSFTAVGTIHISKNYDKEKFTAIPLAVSAIKSRLDEINHRTGTGMMIFGPEQAEPGGGIWKVAEEVTSIENVPNGMIPIEFLEIQYAHFYYSGIKIEMGYVYDKLITWIHNNGDYGNGAMIESWENSLPYESEEYELHLYIPFVWRNNKDPN